MGRDAFDDTATPATSGRGSVGVRHVLSRSCRAILLAATSTTVIVAAACSSNGGAAGDVGSGNEIDAILEDARVHDAERDIGDGDGADGTARGEDAPSDAPEDGEVGDADDAGFDGDGHHLDADPPPPPADTTELGAAPYVIRIDERSEEISLWRDDDELLMFDGRAIRLGVVGRIDDALSYDPYGFEVDNPLFFPTPAIDAWVAAWAFRVLDVREDSVEVGVWFEGGHRGVITIEHVGAGRFTARLVPTPRGAAVAYIRLTPSVSVDEGFYGLGEVFDQVEHRGTVRPMQIEFDEELESAYNEAHVPVPFITGTRGWGLFVESYRPGVFEVAREEDDRIDITFGTGPASEDGLSFHLFAARHPLDVTRHYYETTGYPARPARWALGPWIWRDENDDQAQVISDVETIRELDLATTGYWIDRPYATAVNTFDFAEEMFSEPQEMIDRMRELGFRVALWHSPYLDEDDEATADLRDVAVERGYYPPATGLLLNNWGRPIDLTNPDAYSWWQSLIERYTEMGIEGFKLDYGEDVVVGLAGGRSGWSFFDGSDERTMHSRFQLLYHRVYAETLPETGGFLLCRGGTFGDQTNASVIWPGDLDANFARHGERVIEADGEEYTAVGGLPAAVVAGSSLGPSGFPLFASDTGGYRHAPPDKETFTRWFQHTALSPVMQVGTNANDVPWEFRPENGFDEEMLGWYRSYARLHLRLFPYLWTYVESLHEDGRPIQRALGLAYPELGVHPSDVYLLGDDLLVAPVVEPGVRARSVQLPPGTWFDWWTGERFDGPSEIVAEAPLDRIPLFQRGGSVIPLLRPTIDTLSPTTEPDEIDSFAMAAGPLYARIAASDEGSLALYDGATIEMTMRRADIELRTTAGDELRDQMRLGIYALGGEPDTVLVDGDPLPRADSAAELNGMDSGWHFADSTLGGTLAVHGQLGDVIVLRWFE